MKRKLFGTALGGYLREKSGWLLGFAGMIVCFSLIGWACGLPGSVALYGALLCGAGLLAGCIIGFWRHLRRLCLLRELDALRDPAELPRPRTQIETEYDRLLRQLYREKAELLFFSGISGKKRADKLEIDLYDPQVAQLLDSEEKHRQLIDDVELLSAGREMDMQAVRDGQLSPVFFGSALTNFGIEPFLEAFLKLTPPPLARTADCGVIDPFSPDFSAFVFKIQANMNKAHRDRLAFMRICSGKFQRDAEYFHVQGNKKMRLSQPQQLMAAEREIVDEAYAGDVIGVFDPGIFSIGDTITVPGKKFRYSGIPTFAPEHFCRVSAKDSMKRKQFVKGTEQIAQEGAIQIFKVPGSGFEEVIVGVVGTLQFDVFQYRMKNEYGVELRMEMLPYEEIRLIDEYPGDLTDLNLGSDAELLEDYRGRSLLVFSSFWAIDFTCRRNPGLKVSEIVVAEG